MGSMEYFFIAITPRSTQIRNDSTFYGLIGQIDLLKNYSYSIGLWTKNLKKQRNKMFKNERDSLTSQ